MITLNENKMNTSLCGNCKHYLLIPGDTFGSWCTYYKDIFKAVHNGKIVIEGVSEPIDRSLRYDLNGLVYCEGYKPK